MTAARRQPSKSRSKRMPRSRPPDRHNPKDNIRALVEVESQRKEEARYKTVILKKAKQKTTKQLANKKFVKRK